MVLQNVEEQKLGYLDRVRLFKRDARLYIASNAFGSFAFGISNVIFNLYMIEAGFAEDFLGFFLSISMFGTAAIGLDTWFPILIVSSSVLILVELEKYVVRYMSEKLQSNRHER